MRYNWQHPGWPNFIYDQSQFSDLIYRYAMTTGIAHGELLHLSQDQIQETTIEMMLTEAINTSLIEGEVFDLEDVRSSLRNRLGLSALKSHVKDSQAVGIAKLMIDVRETFNKDLSAEYLWAWHKMLMEHAPQSQNINIGNWRRDASSMQIVSGPIGHEKIHFEAPPSQLIPEQMTRFIQWFNESRNLNMPGPVRAAIAHLYFESIHPFDDGNGRIGRALSEKALSQDLGRPVTLSLSKIIQNHKKQYYTELHAASGYGLEINRWLEFFFGLILEAQLDAKNTIEYTLHASKFWQKFEKQLNERQVIVMKRLWACGPSGFLGGLNASKYMKLTGCSKATATRDLQDLLIKECIRPLPGEGRSTRYELEVVSFL